MIKALTIAFGLIFSFVDAHAFVVPSFYSLKRIAERKGEFKNAIVEFRIFRPVADKKQKPEMLWSGELFYPPLKTSQVSFEQRMPVIPLYLEQDPKILINFFKLAGFGANQEEDMLLWSPEEMKKSENPPAPFYKLNSAASIIRYKGRTAMEYRKSKDDLQLKRFLVEKDSYYPLLISEKCPQAMLDLAYGTSDSDICSIEFEYRSGNLPFSTPQLAYVSINDRRIAVIRIDKIIVDPNPAQIAKAQRSIGQADLTKSDDIVAALYKFILY